VPLGIVTVGLERLLRWEVFQLFGNRLVMPNYLKAQNAIRNDKARQRDLREKRLAQSRLVTLRDSGVTPRDESSREPTPDNGASQDVTLLCASLPSADLSLSKVPGLTLVASPEQTDPALHIRIPEGWTPGEGLYAEAFAAGVTRAGLEEAVRYWRGRKLGGEWFSPEEFFRGKFAAIKLREERTRFSAHQDSKSGPRAAPGNDVETTQAATAFSATSDHLKFCKAHGLDCAQAIAAYRKGTRPGALGTAPAWDDFMSRLKCWAVTGTFYPDGPLPRPGPRKTPGGTPGKEATA
jgi:hypothetical protein